MKCLNEYQIELLKDDFDYYSMDLPEELLPPPPVVVVSSWDENRKSINATLSNNNLTVTKTSGNYNYNCGVIGSQAIDRYTVRIYNIEDEDIMVGFSTGASWDPNGYNYRKNGWFLCLYTGYLWGIGAVDGEPYTNEEFNTGDYITVIREGTTIRFQKNKVDLGVCTSFSNIPDQPLLPVLDVGSKNISLTLVHDY